MLFRGMKIYTVHARPDTPLPEQKPLFVREGFSFTAFLFHFLWMFYHRMWLHGIAFLLFFALLVYIGKLQLLTSDSIGIIQLGVQVFVGFQANDWWRTSLTRRGLPVADIVTGDSLLRAQQRYFDRSLSATGG